MGRAPRTTRSKASSTEGPTPAYTSVVDATRTADEALEYRSGRSLAECEAVIRRGLKVFIEVGEALCDIRDGRLYRKLRYTTFEDYCRNRWGHSRIHAHRLIAAFKVATILLPTGNVPVNERQTRPLMVLRDHPEAMTQAWLQAVEATDGKPTEGAVAVAVQDQLERLEGGAELSHIGSDAAHAETAEDYAARAGHILDPVSRGAVGLKEVILMLREDDWRWFVEVCKQAKVYLQVDNNSAVVLASLRFMVAQRTKVDKRGLPAVPKGSLRCPTARRRGSA